MIKVLSKFIRRRRRLSLQRDHKNNINYISYNINNIMRTSILLDVKNLYPITRVRTHKHTRQVVYAWVSHAYNNIIYVVFNLNRRRRSTRMINQTLDRYV